MAIISNGTTIADAGSFSASLGSMVHIKTLTASSSSTLSFVHGSASVVLDSTYPIYLFKFTSIHPSTDGVDFTFQGSTNTGSAYGVTSTNTYFNNYANEAGTATALGYEAVADIAQGTGEIELIREEKLSADNDHCGSGELYLFNPSSTTYAKHYLATSQANHAAEYTMNSFIGGYFNTTSAIDAIRFKVNSGNMATGTIKLYGIKDS
tara:strand:- start:428 stop:1051 length:624 start_codon:yes stop_codon:yes gene_type:complete